MLRVHSHLNIFVPLRAGVIDLLAYTKKDSDIPVEWCALLDGRRSFAASDGVLFLVPPHSMRLNLLQGGERSSLH